MTGLRFDIAGAESLAMRSLPVVLTGLVTILRRTGPFGGPLGAPSISRHDRLNRHGERRAHLPHVVMRLGGEVIAGQSNAPRREALMAAPPKIR